MFSIFARDGYFKCWTWTPVTCIFFDCKFLKKYLLGVACKAREHAILNHKNDKLCTFFSLYKNVDKCRKIESQTFPHLVFLHLVFLLQTQQSFIRAIPNLRTLGLLTHLVLLCEYIEFNRFLKLRWKLSDES